MKHYLIDSDVLMDFFKKKDYAVVLLEKLLRTDSLAASILSITELRAGWDKKRARYFLPRLYELIVMKNLNQQIVELAGELRWEYKTKGISLPTIDTLIAATAILEKCQLVTRNKKDYPMPEIKLYQIKE